MSQVQLVEARTKAAVQKIESQAKAEAQRLEADACGRGKMAGGHPMHPARPSWTRVVVL